MAPTASVELPLIEPDDCVACADRLRVGLASHRGVTDVGPVAGKDAVLVSYDPDLCSLDCLDQAAHGLRLDLEGAYAHRIIRIDGMDCGDCAQTLERAVSRVDGVTHVAVSFPAETMRLEYRPGVVDLGRIDTLVERLGYTCRHPEQPAALRRRWPMRVGATVASAGLLGIGLAVDFLTDLPAAPVYGAAAAIGGLPLARSGISALMATRRPEIRLLMTIAVIGASAIGAWLEAALVVVLFSVGEMLEQRAVDRARRQLAGLVSLTPQTARVRRRTDQGPLALVEEVEIPIMQVRVGDIVVIRPGESIPVDGVVRDGASAVDQATITGESTPVDKTTGDSVFAGTFNGQGLLAVEATTVGGDTTLDRIARLVDEARARKSPSERWVDAFAKWYTPVVVAIAALVAIVPPILGATFATSLYTALALLIIACPCALVISTPVTIVCALGRSAAAGVLVKGGAHLEMAATVRAVAFDKTGTLTQGRPRVVAIHALSGSDDALLTLAASVEHGSEHPLAKAIVDAALARQLPPLPVKEFTAHTGLGASGRVQGSEVTVGDPRLLDAALPPFVEARLATERASGHTGVIVVRDGDVAGVIALADTLKDGATEAIADLRALGVDRVTLLTGDNDATATAIARRVGIDDVSAGLLPHEKAAALGTLGHGVAMVGDGVNDAPALATAHLGIAMGTAGSDTATEVADIAILGDDPRKVAGLIGLARWTKGVVRQNLAFSLVTKVLAAGLLALGALPLWGAVVADVGASLAVVGNGLRLIGGRPIGPSRGLPLLTRAQHSHE